MDDTSIPELSPEERRKAKNRENSARYRARHPEKIRALNASPYHVAYRAAHEAEFREYRRNYEVRHHEEITANKQTPEFKERKRAHDRKDYAKHRANRLGRNRGYHRNYVQTEHGRAKKKTNSARRRARIADAPINDFTDAEWRALCKAAGYRCAYCGEKFPFEELTPDHLTPYADKGSNTLHNILPCCGSCNSRKQHRAVLKPVQPFLLLPEEDAAAD
jgi:5-methylcytosine-specific restriction endonuclease McrA